MVGFAPAPVQVLRVQVLQGPPDAWRAGEQFTPADTGHKFERDYSLCHSDRHMDDFGIELSTPAPAWDEEALPCGTMWYGGGT